MKIEQARERVEDFLTRQMVDPGEADPPGTQWLYERCREVEAEPDDALDLWSGSADVSLVSAV